MHIHLDFMLVSVSFQLLISAAANQFLCFDVEQVLAGKGRSGLDISGRSS
jgi:hypothetical protein